MAEVTGYTAAKVDGLIAGAVVGASIDTGTGHLGLTTVDGSSIDAGSVFASIPDASTTVQGIVELATDVESTTGTDTARAVTPFGLAAVIAASKQSFIVSGVAESSAPTSYPVGISSMALTSSAWSLNSGNGSVTTYRPDTNHTYQVFQANNGSGGYSRAWTREYTSTAWTVWSEYSLVATLTAGSFTQTTAFTSYPQGSSRIYYTSANSTSWDFTGFAGEVLTYRDGTDFARQTFTKHIGGSTGGPAKWERTATSVGGWTPWLVLAEDSGWITIPGTLASGYSSSLPTQYRRVNGVVHLRGAFVAPTSNFTDSGLVLPAGYRPSIDVRFPVSSNTTVTMVGSVTSIGKIQTWVSATTTSPFNISCISFPVG